MKAKIDPAVCVGCGLCTDICPEVFKMDGDVAVVRVDAVQIESEAACREATSACPVTAISIEET